MFARCTFGTQLNGFLQSSVSLQSSSFRTPESVTPSAAYCNFLQASYRNIIHLCHHSKAQLNMQVFSCNLRKNSAKNKKRSANSSFFVMNIQKKLSIAAIYAKLTIFSCQKGHAPNVLVQVAKKQTSKRIRLERN